MATKYGYFIVGGIFHRELPNVFALETRGAVRAEKVLTLNDSSVAMVASAPSATVENYRRQRKNPFQFWTARFEQDSPMPVRMRDQLVNYYTTNQSFWLQFDDEMNRCFGACESLDTSYRAFHTPTRPIVPYGHEPSDGPYNFDGHLFVNGKEWTEDVSIDPEYGIIDFGADAGLSDLSAVALRYSWRAYVRVAAINVESFDLAQNMYVGEVIFQQLDMPSWETLKWIEDPWSVCSPEPNLGFSTGRVQFGGFAKGYVFTPKHFAQSFGGMVFEGPPDGSIGGKDTVGKKASSTGDMVFGGQAIGYTSVVVPGIASFGGFSFGGFAKTVKNPAQAQGDTVFGGFANAFAYPAVTPRAQSFGGFSFSGTANAVGQTGTQYAQSFGGFSFGGFSNGQHGARFAQSFGVLSFDGYAKQNKAQAGGGSLAEVITDFLLAEDDDSTGARVWANPMDALSNDAVSAYLNPSSGLSHYLKATNLRNKSFLTGRKIQKIEITVYRKTMQNGYRTNDLQASLVLNGVIQSTNKADPVRWPFNVETPITYTWLENELTGITTSELLLSNFGFALSVSAVKEGGLSFEPTQENVNYIKIRIVYYGIYAIPVDGGTIIEG